MNPVSFVVFYDTIQQFRSSGSIIFVIFHDRQDTRTFCLFFNDNYNTI